MRTLLFSLLALVLALPALAQTQEPKLPEPIEKLKQDGAKLRYLGRDLGYDAWIAVQDGQEQYFYVTPDQSAFFLGVLFNKNGRAVTFDQLQRLKGSNDPILQDLYNAPSPAGERAAAAVTAPTTPDSKLQAPKSAAGSPAEQLLADVEKAAGFTMGQANTPLIYMFIDPLCPHCKDMLNDARPLVDGGKLRVRVVPVGAIAPESVPLAASLLASKEPGKALYDFMGGNLDALKMDGVAPTAPIDANLAILAKWKFDITPVSVYRAKNGTIKLIRGRANDLQKVIQDLT